MQRKSCGEPTRYHCLAGGRVRCALELWSKVSGGREKESERSVSLSLSALSALLCVGREPSQHLLYADLEGGNSDISENHLT